MAVDQTGTPDKLPGDALAAQSGRRKRSFFGRVNERFQDAIQNSRGDDRRQAVERAAPAQNELALRRPSPGRTVQRMIVPEGVVIQGSMNSASEAEISGHVNGDVIVEGRVFLGPTAIISGNVKSANSRVEGTVEGKLECAEELDLGSTGKLMSDTIAGKKMTLAGEVNGNVTCGGLLRLVATARVTGNIRARSIVIEEGAVFNGACSTPAPKKRSTP